MDLAIHVDHRQRELHALATELRWSRRRPSLARLARRALGRRLVRAGTALLSDPRRPASLPG